jgi:phytoene synthase
MSLTIPYQHAIADVKARVMKSRSSFHAGMMILPRARREAMYAVYAFCREVDDIADDSPTPEASARGLQKWRERIASLFHQGVSSDYITAALAPAIKPFGLIEGDFQALIDGMAMDSTVICAPDMKTLDLYCDRVASAVGRISVRIFGDASPRAMEVAHHLGRAFQLTNILRDLGEDAARGRLYLPEELLAKHGVPTRVPNEVLRDARLSAVCNDLAAQAHAHFAEADKAMLDCVPSAMRPARIMRGYYGAILDRVENGGWRDPFTRIRLPKWRKAWIVLRHIAV